MPRIDTWSSCRPNFRRGTAFAGMDCCSPPPVAASAGNAPEKAIAAEVPTALLMKLLREWLVLDIVSYPYDASAARFSNRQNYCALANSLRLGFQRTSGKLRK